nr:MAG TPA: hypothetical protein [Caudoviricetes sp.]
MICYEFYLHTPLHSLELQNIRIHLYEEVCSYIRVRNWYFLLHYIFRMQ